MDIHARIYNKYTLFFFSSFSSLCLNIAHTAACILDRYIYIYIYIWIHTDHGSPFWIPNLFLSQFMSVYFFLSLSLSLSLFPWIRIDRNGELRADILNEIFQWYSLAAVIISYYIYIYIYPHTTGTYTYRTIKCDEKWSLHPLARVHLHGYNL